MGYWVDLVNGGWAVGWLKWCRVGWRRTVVLGGSGHGGGWVVGWIWSQLGLMESISGGWDVGWLKRHRIGEILVFSMFVKRQKISVFIFLFSVLHLFYQQKLLLVIHVHTFHLIINGNCHW